MYFLKCNHCGNLNEVNSEFLIFCQGCKRKLENNFSDWKKSNPDKTLDDFRKLMCISAEEIKKINLIADSRKPRGLSFWIGFIIVFGIFSIIGVAGGKKIAGYFGKTSFDKAIMAYASEINKSCPIMIDNATRLDNTIALPGKVFQYNYTILSLAKDSVNTEEIKNYLEPKIINNIKTDPQMKFVRDYHTTMQYNYKDKHGEFLFMITVKPEQYK